MPKVMNVEKKIWDVEGFNVVFSRNGKNIRGDKNGMPQYLFSNAAKNDITVTKWKDLRINPNYPGIDVAVLDGDGNAVAGNSKVGSIRDSYSEE
ncbi:MAG: hypothetical protein HY892_11895 [Deltaproteobacteria bacterium]|nr:hypothetical protein [Deltaproteobacteria bacterium]